MGIIRTQDVEKLVKQGLYGPRSVAVKNLKTMQKNSESQSENSPENEREE